MFPTRVELEGTCTNGRCSFIWEGDIPFRLKKGDTVNFCDGSCWCFASGHEDSEEPINGYTLEEEPIYDAYLGRLVCWFYREWPEDTVEDMIDHFTYLSVFKFESRWNLDGTPCEIEEEQADVGTGNQSTDE